MDIMQIIVAGIILCLAGMAQSAVGFGYALFATPLLLLYGLPLPNVITLVATCSMCQAMIGAHNLRGVIPWKISWIATSVRLAGLICGLVLLRLLVELDREIVQLVVGLIICVMVVIQFTWRPKPAEKTHAGLAGGAFFTSGLFSGTCGMGGPPLVLWVMAQNWNSRTTRGFLFTVLAALVPIQVLLMTISFGWEILWQVLYGFALLPFVYLGTAIGLPLGDRIEKQSLQRIAYVILLVVGISAVAPALKYL